MADPKQAKPLGVSSLEEFRYLQQIYQNQYMMLAEQITGHTDRLREFEATRLSLENIDSLKERGALIPMGSNTFVNGRIADEDTVLVGIGAGYFAEKNIDKAKGYISSMITKEEESIKKLATNKKELEKALIEISYKIEELSH